MVDPAVAVKRLAIYPISMGVCKWVKLSSNNGHKWVVSIDEPWWGKRPNGLADILRKEIVWGAALAGGQMEFYTGKDDVSTLITALMKTAGR